jgi:glucokinase
VLGVDIGGTNTNLVIAGIRNKNPTLLFSLNFKSQELPSLIPAVKETISFANKTYRIYIDNAVIGAAGVVSSSHDAATLTNVPWDISKKRLLENTSLSSVYIMNDFQMIGYGINMLNPKNNDDLFLVKPGWGESSASIATKAILGAGTGLGKSILVYDEHFDAHIPIPSEGGHEDFPMQNEFEIKLATFIKKLRNIKQPLSYEEVLSGRGIEVIYQFLRNTQQFKVSKYTEEIDATTDKAPLISNYKEKDETCKETFRLFTRFYGRCAKNFVLDSLARGGLYIAGGIASKNKEIFMTKDFINEFVNAHQRSEVLKKIPVYIIVNYDVSLYGACFAAMYHLQKDTT